jgi:hypothetical protein
MARAKRTTFAAFVFGMLTWGIHAHAGLVGYYPLDGNFADASGNGNNGIPGSPSPTFGPGESGAAQDQGAVFSGTSASQLLTLPININADNQVTFGAWVQPTSANPILGFLGNDAGGFGREIAIDNRSGTTGYSAYDGTGVLGAGPVSPAGFDFVAVVYDHSAGTDTLYVNGQKFTTTGTPPPGNTFLTVGDDASVGNPFAGTIDDIFVYDTALTDSEIASIRQNGISAASLVPLPRAFSMAAAALACLGVYSIAKNASRRHSRPRQNQL